MKINGLGELTTTNAENVKHIQTTNVSNLRYDCIIH